MHPFAFLYLALFSCATACSQSLRIKETVVAPCRDQDLIFRDSVTGWRHNLRGNELELDFTFIAACCQNIEVITDPGFEWPKLALRLRKSGEICDCYCQYPIKTTVVLPDLKQVSAIEWYINKKPMGKIPTGQ